MASARMVWMQRTASCALSAGGAPRCGPVAVCASRAAAGAPIRGSCDVAGVCAISCPPDPRTGVSLYGNRVAFAFPAVLFHPQERELNRRVLVGQYNIDEFNPTARGTRPCVVRMLPCVAGPGQQERGARLDAEERAGGRRWHLTIAFPHLHGVTLPVAGHVAVVGGVDAVEDGAVCGGAL